MTKGKAEFLNWLFWMCYMFVCCFIAAMLIIYWIEDFYFSIDHRGLRALFGFTAILIGAGIGKLGIELLEPIAERLFGKYM